MILLTAVCVPYRSASRGRGYSYCRPNEDRPMGQSCQFSPGGYSMAQARGFSYPVSKDGNW